MYSIKEFLQSKDITVSDEKGKRLLFHDINEYNILKHIELLTDFHQKVKVSEGFFLLCFPSEIGKSMEEFKVEFKRLKRLMDRLEKNTTSIGEEWLSIEGKKIIERCEACLGKVTREEYITLIKRSMRQNEICIGNPMECNLFYDNGIKVYDTSQMAFNMLEWDCINYLSKLKRKGVRCDWNKAIDVFCTNNKLNGVSKDYILAMISFPYEFFKVVNRFKSSSLKDQELIDKIENSKVKDGEVLI